MILKEDIADVILVGNRDKVLEAGKGCDLSKAIIIDPENYERMDEVVAAFCEARKSKGLTPEEALQTLSLIHIFFGLVQRFGSNRNRSVKQGCRQGCFC